MDGRGFKVGALADVEAHQGAGAAAEQARSPAGHRDQAGPQEIPFLLPDADADDDDRARDDPGEEDRDGDGDDHVSHGRPPYFQPMVGSLAGPAAPARK